MGKKRKDRYRWTCTGCGHEIEQHPATDTFEARCAARDLIVELAAEHLRGCPSASFEDVDGYYRPDASLHPYVRPRVRRVRKIAFMQIGKNKTLHLDYGTEVTPCGLAIGGPDGTEVSAADFYSGKLPKSRLCRMCVAHRRSGIAEEMAALEAQFSGGVARLKS